MYRCMLEKEGFFGTLFESASPTDKCIIMVGGSDEKRECRRARQESWDKLVAFFREW